MSRNFGAAASDYATFRAGFPDLLFDKVQGLGVAVEGAELADLGTGTGSLARGFALRGARVTGIDPDDRMLDQARQLDVEHAVTVDYRCGTAEAIPLKDTSVDVLSAGQCWHWFDAPVAAGEMARVLRPAGRVIVAHFDWLPIPGSVVAQTEALILQHNPSWHLGGGDGFHPESLPDLRAAGFTGFQTATQEIDVPYTPEAWRGRIRASAGVGASLSSSGVQQFDQELASLIAADHPQEVLPVPHRIFVLVGILGGEPSSQMPRENGT